MQNLESEIEVKAALIRVRRAEFAPCCAKQEQRFAQLPMDAKVDQGLRVMGNCVPGGVIPRLTEEDTQFQVYWG